MTRLKQPEDSGQVDQPEDSGQVDESEDACDALSHMQDANCTLGSQGPPLQPLAAASVEGATEEDPQDPDYDPNSDCRVRRNRGRGSRRGVARNRGALGRRLPGGAQRVNTAAQGKYSSYIFCSI